MKEKNEDKKPDNALLTFLLSVLDKEEEKAIISKVFEGKENSKIIEDAIQYPSIEDHHDRD